jgi:hypothetical protein
VQYTVSAELIETFSVFVAPEMEDEKIDLTRAGLVLARSEYPKLEIEAYAARLEQLAPRVPALVPDCHSQFALAASTAYCLRN